MRLEDAQRMAESLMESHGLHNYRFEWMTPRRNFNTAGQHNGLHRTIRLQPYFAKANYPFIVKRTMLHEIAHALVGGRHKHNYVWENMARRVGHDGRRCYGKEVKRDRVIN